MDQRRSSIIVSDRGLPLIGTGFQASNRATSASVGLGRILLMMRRSSSRLASRSSAWHGRAGCALVQQAPKLLALRIIRASAAWRTLLTLGLTMFAPGSNCMLEAGSLTHTRNSSCRHRRSQTRRHKEHHTGLLQRTEQGLKEPCCRHLRIELLQDLEHEMAGNVAVHFCDFIHLQFNNPRENGCAAFAQFGSGPS